MLRYTNFLKSMQKTNKKELMQYYIKHYKAVLSLAIIFLLLFFVANLTLNTIDFLTNKLN